MRHQTDGERTFKMAKCGIQWALILCMAYSGWMPVQAQESGDHEADPPVVSAVEPEQYLAPIIAEMNKEWPRNRTVRFLFHGHSVPAGYFKTPRVQRFDSYPLLFQRALGEQFPTAVIDVDITAIGGETAERGAERFEEDVLTRKPDVVLIDYSLNDRRLGLPRARAAWRSMVEQCQAAGVKVVLLTATPDSRESMTDPDVPLQQHADQVRRLGEELSVPVVDVYGEFRRRIAAGDAVEKYLSQVNHPNRVGHEVVTQLLLDRLGLRQDAGSVDE